MTGMAATGSTAKAAVKVYSNKLVATVAQDTAEAVGATVTAGTATDLGAFTSTSGMATLKAYLTAVVADTGSAAAVHFDTVDSITNSTGAEQLANQTYATTPLTTRVLSLTAGSGDAIASSGETKGKRAFIVVLGTAGTWTLHKTAATTAGIPLFSNGTAATTAASVTTNANKTFMLSAIKAQTNIDRFAAYGITMDAYDGGNSTGVVSLVQYGLGGTTTATVVGQRYTTTVANGAAVSTTNYGFGLDDLATLTVGSNSVTVSMTGQAQTVTTLTAIGNAIVSAWAAKYGAGGTASASAIATVTNSAGSLAITMLDKGSTGFAKDVNFSIAAGSVTATNAANIDYAIGTTLSESDDATVAANIIVTVESIQTGSLLNAVSALVSSSSATNLVELTSTQLTNGTDTTDVYLETQEARSDVRIAEGVRAAVADTTPAVSYSRLGWL
jgi:hypothetical protein|tara:strand:+ start:1 stop:1332 length:1332 start_codon:yes stop_codon:yes gene_type:complete